MRRRQASPWFVTHHSPTRLTDATSACRIQTCKTYTSRVQRCAKSAQGGATLDSGRVLGSSPTTVEGGAKASPTMQYLVGSTQTLLLAALLLTVVGSLPSLPAVVGASARWRVPSLVVPALGGMFLLGLALRHSPVLPDALPYRVARSAAAEMEQASEPNVIVIDGGSYVLNAVDAEVLETELRKLGYTARAFRFAAGGANHFERYQMQQEALRRVKRKPEPQQRWLYLAEVQQGYDAKPLAQFEENLDSIRSYYYLTPENAWYAARALRSTGSDVPLDGAWHWPLLRHVLVNATNTGAFQRVVPEADIGFHTNRVADPPRRGRFRFRGLLPVMKAAHQQTLDATVPGWLRNVREPRSRRLWQGRIDELVYFGVPTTRASQMTYIRAFCRSTRVRCLAPANKALLDARAAWRNPTHLAVAGATEYSRWLASELAAAGVLRK